MARDSPGRARTTAWGRVFARSGRLLLQMARQGIPWRRRNPPKWMSYGSTSSLNFLQKSTLPELHGKIAAVIEEPKDLEQEIFDTEEIQDEILETSCLISRFINLTLSDKKFTQPPSPTIPEYTATTSHPSVEY